MSERIQSFEEFWPYYVGEHSKKTTRVLHFVGTSAALACVAGFALTRKTWLLPAALVAGYGPAWISHFFIEKNRPATFTYPAWSLAADFKMFGLMLQGKMDAEVERVMAARRDHDPHTNGRSTQATAPDFAAATPAEPTAN